MNQHVCPWWLGYLLASPLRRLYQSPRAILDPWVSEGMTVLEPGPGMGFFTLELAGLVGPNGRVIAVDLQAKMLESLVRRAKRAGLQDRIQVRQARGESLGIDDLEGTVDFVLAFAVVHELPNAAAFFAEAHRALKPDGKLLVAEPKHHVSEAALAETVTFAEKAGFVREATPAIRRSRSVLLAPENSK
ncbi:class I SAM-dependent methyltransferase [Myxococcota bacterium]